MADKATEFTIRGQIDWCKLIGKARPHTGLPKYDKGPYWSVEINPDEKSRALLAKHGLDEKFKRDKPTAKNPRSYDFIRLTILENKANGEKNDPPVIIDASGRKWGDEELGNGTVVDILCRYVDYGDTKGLYFKKMRVLRHVPYEGGSDFEPLSEDDEFFSGGFDASKDGAEIGSSETDAKGKTPNPDDLDDDVPF